MSSQNLFLEQEKHVLKCVKNLYEIAKDTLDAMEELPDGQLNDLISNEYPFNESFDEVVFDLKAWAEEIEASVNKLEQNKDIKEEVIR